MRARDGAGTNYGENISAMAITKVFSTAVLIVAAIVAMIISCFTPLINAIYAIPTPVIGGLEIYLFGAIAAQGIAIMIEKKADMFSSKNIAVIACIMIIGVGGKILDPLGGNINFFGASVPCIAGAAVFGIAAEPPAEHRREEGASVTLSLHGRPAHSRRAAFSSRRAAFRGVLPRHLCCRFSALTVLAPGAYGGDAGMRLYCKRA